MSAKIGSIEEMQDRYEVLKRLRGPKWEGTLEAVDLRARIEQKQRLRSRMMKRIQRLGQEIEA